jgi:hypothetical protein
MIDHSYKVSGEFNPIFYLSLLTLFLCLYFYAFNLVLNQIKFLLIKLELILKSLIATPCSP